MVVHVSVAPHGFLLLHSVYKYMCIKLRHEAQFASYMHTASEYTRSYGLCMFLDISFDCTGLYCSVLLTHI